MNMMQFLVNPAAENPTAGFRGLVALLVALSTPFWMDWRTDGVLLAVVFFGGILTALNLFSEASKAKE